MLYVKCKVVEYFQGMAVNYEFGISSRFCHRF
jgi:hypothetical protein